MTLSTIQAILSDRKIAYAITDVHLRIIKVGGAIEILNDGSTGWVSNFLMDLVPEFVGTETVIEHILAGEQPRLEVSWINRE